MLRIKVSRPLNINLREAEKVYGNPQTGAGELTIFMRETAS